MPDPTRRLPALLPAPKRVTPARGSFSLRRRPPIVLAPEAGEAEVASARALRAGVEAHCGLVLPIEWHARARDLGARIELRSEGERGEAYRLTVASDRVEVLGNGTAGLRYGVETLLQLLRSAGNIPACAIEDAPDFQLRGIMLDVSRGKVPNRKTLHQLVDLCVRLKLNALMLYVEHTFQFRRHPRIGSGASPLDAATLRELDDYAAERHVELIPSLQSLGHMEHILKLPEYTELAETDRCWTISPSEPGSYELLSDLLSEYLPIFRSRLFNANCDEPFDLEAGKSARRASELGAGGVYLEHVRRIRDMAGSLGKRTMIWGDVVHSLPERIPEIDRDLVLLDWWYEADFDFDRVKRFADSGIEFVVCPGTSSWNSLFPRIDNSIENIAGYANAGRRHGALGLVVTDWGDFGHYNLQGNSWFGYAWAAQQAWSGSQPARDFDRSFSNVVFGDPSGRTARSYRELGAIHDAGFSVFNGSALQFLYFDDLDRGYFVEGAKPATLRRSARRIERAAARLDAAREAFQPDDLSWRELRLATDASRLAIRKGLAGRDYIRWRRARERFDARARRRLGRELTDLATEQRALGRTLRKLWLERSRPSNFEITAGRLDRSVRSLRRAARALSSNRIPSPPPPHPGFGVGNVFAALRESAAQ
jgi:hypothetical protein